MALRIASGIVGLVALGWVTLTIAQPQGDDQARPGPKAQLRSKVATLRAEVEFLQLEHDVDVLSLKELIKCQKELDIQNLTTVDEIARARRDYKERFNHDVFQGKTAELFRRMDLFNKALSEDEIKQEKEQNEARAKIYQLMVNELKNGFIDRSMNFNKKKIELAELEQRLSLVN